MPAGTPDQLKGGEMSLPSQVYSLGIAPPGIKAGLINSKGISLSVYGAKRNSSAASISHSASQRAAERRTKSR